MRSILGALSTGVIALAVACAGPGELPTPKFSTDFPVIRPSTPEQTFTPPPSTGQGEQQPVKSPAPMESDGAERLPELAATTEIPLISDEVPEGIVTSIIADVEKRTGADPTEFQMLRNEPVVWNNGSLGCPKPGEFYTQALVDGYWVVLSFQGQEFDYRVNSQGFFLLCEESTLPGVGLPGGGASDNPVQ